ncbi:hypothetical protein [Pyxidicoccus sp. MSG2]|uniref:hypothetical protein n=1 Tax=Pyxidicoccus sp. MSG2 TaxID=2996790 RepID=UPI00226EA2CA|nr:hypothetical protein [Pyxidicoccus sp. MSG2]MCY1020079.1 hypothetical protein [Pyxidicoccus sp. MSG2]
MAHRSGFASRSALAGAYAALADLDTALPLLAFAEHAAEFYLGPGADAERAWVLAQQNLAGRQTDRALTLALEAARATGRQREVCALAARVRAGPVAEEGCPGHP